MLKVSADLRGFHGVFKGVAERFREFQGAFLEFPGFQGVLRGLQRASMAFFEASVAWRVLNDIRGLKRTSGRFRRFQGASEVFRESQGVSVSFINV